MSFPNCPQCQSEYTYQDGELFICPECSHEWKQGEGLASEQQEIIKDAMVMCWRMVTVSQWLKT